MSFQGSGAGISGTSNQFAVGYAQSAGYTSGNIGGYAPQAGYANQAAATAQTLQLTSVQGNTQWGWQGQQSNPAWLWGSNQGTVNTVFSPGALQVSYAGYAGSAGNINGYAPQAGYANQGAATAANIQSAGGINGTQWNWAGQPGTPGHVWGGNQGSPYYVWGPGQMTVGYANSAGNINGYAPTAGYTNGNIGGYAPQAGYANQASATAQTLQIQGTGSSNWAWQGQSGIPNHYWGSNDGYTNYVWQMNQGYVGYAGSAGNINGYAPSAGYANNAGALQNGGYSYPVYLAYGQYIFLGLPPIYNNSYFAQLYNVGVNGVTGAQAAAYQSQISAYFGYSILTGGRVYAISDKRVKKKFTDETPPQYLDNINKLQVERFTWTDTVKNGSGVDTGFFAQDIESIIPEAVSESPDFIPNVYKLSEYVDSETRTIKLTDHGLAEGDYVKYLNKQDIIFYANVIKVIDQNTFVFDGVDKIPDKIFIYGKRVYDFKVVAKDRIVPHAVGAIQDLYKMIVDLQSRVEKLESCSAK